MKKSLMRFYGNLVVVSVLMALAGSNVHAGTDDRALLLNVEIPSLNRSLYYSLVKDGCQVLPGSFFAVSEMERRPNAERKESLFRGEVDGLTEIDWEKNRSCTNRIMNLKVDLEEVAGLGEIEVSIDLEDGSCRVSFDKLFDGQKDVAAECTQSWSEIARDSEANESGERK